MEQVTRHPSRGSHPTQPPPPRPPVPHALWARKKQGFTLPFDDWLRSGEISSELPEHPLLRRQGLEEVMRDYARGAVHWTRPWSLIVLREFLR